MESSSSTEDDAPYQISVSARCGGADVDSKAILRAARTTLSAHKRTCATLSITLVDDQTMTDLHGRYMDQYSPTDVMTFDLADNADTVDAEIVISVDTATREAQRRGHSIADEVVLYVIHGLLHLLGYDDHTDDDARKMHERENELLTQLGIGPVYGEIPG